MENEVLVAAEALIAAHLWKAIILFIVSFIMVALIKQTAVNALNLILMKTDVFGIGSLIYYGGKKYRIQGIAFRRIELYRLDSKETISIRTENWKKFELLTETTTCIENNKET